MMGFGALFTLLGFGALAYALGWRFPQDNRAVQRQGGDSALDILRMRYARGEITRAQYEEMRRDLESI